MKALVLEKNSKFVYKDVESPSSNRPSDAVVEIISAGVCSSDIPRAFNRGAYFYPIILGHEVFGEIRTGKGKRETVVIYPLISCGRCSFCKSGAVNTCKRYDYIGSRRDGGFAEHMTVPKKNIIAAPENIDPIIAAITEPAAVVFHALRKACLLKEDKVLIVGDGPMGLILTRLLVSYGFSNVYLSGKHAYKTKIAREFGAHIIDNSANLIERKYNAFFDAVFELAGTNSGYKDSIMAVKPHGKLVFIGNIRNDLHLSKFVFSQILRKEILVTGSWNSLPSEWGKVLIFLNNAPEIKKVVSHIYDLKDAACAMHDMYSRALKGYTKAVFLIK